MRVRPFILCCVSRGCPSIHLAAKQAVYKLATLLYVGPSCSHAEEFCQDHLSRGSRLPLSKLNVHLIPGFRVTCLCRWLPLFPFLYEKETVERCGLLMKLPSPRQCDSMRSFRHLWKSVLQTRNWVALTKRNDSKGGRMGELSKCISSLKLISKLSQDPSLNIRGCTKISQSIFNKGVCRC